MNKHIKKYLLDDEQVYDFAVQRRYFGLTPLFPEIIALTSRRILFIAPKLTGCKMMDSMWMNVKNIHIEEHMMSSRLICTMTDNKVIALAGLRKDDALRLYKQGQKIEEQMVEYRRQLELDKNRAGASNIVLNTPDVSARATPLSAVTPTTAPVPHP